MAKIYVFRSEEQVVFSVDETGANLPKSTAAWIRNKHPLAEMRVVGTDRVGVVDADLQAGIEKDGLYILPKD